MELEAQFQEACRLVQRGREWKALPILTELLDDNPSDWRIYAEIGEASMRARLFRKAEKAFKLALALYPNHKILQISLIDCYINQRRYKLACKLLDIVKGSFIGTPDAPRWAASYGVYLAGTERFEEAEKYFRYVLQETPGWAKIYGCMGNLEVLRYRFKDGLRWFEKQWALQKDWEHAQDLGFHLQLNGFWRAGFEMLLTSAKLHWTHDRLQGRRDWTGRPCDEAIVFEDGGLGDLVHYGRYLAIAKQRVKRLLFVPEERHAAIVKYLNFPAELVSDVRTVPKNIPAAWQMTLPGVLGIPDPKDSPAPLVPTFEPVYLPHPAVAITWAGDPKFANKHYRQISLVHWRQLILDHPEIHWFTVSPGASVKRKIDRMKLPITQYSGDFLQACRYLTSADAYVGIDTGHAHVTATAGIPTHIVLHRWVDQRWGIDGDRTPYYNPVRLYRSYLDGGFAPSLRRISAELSNLQIRGETS